MSAIIIGQQLNFGQSRAKHNRRGIIQNLSSLGRYGYAPITFPHPPNRPRPRPRRSFFLKLFASFGSEFLDRQAFSSTLFFGTLICFALWLVGSMAASNLMPFYVVLLLGSLAVLSRTTE